MPPAPKLENSYLGSALESSRDLEAVLRRWRDLLIVERPDNLSEHVARRLSAGAIAAWVQGRAEFGPRALGHRSILADPRHLDTKVRVNAIIKEREAFRPFAPMVTQEAAARFFELTMPPENYRFMTFVVNVRPQWRSSLAAVTHCDGTARIQTVSEAGNAEIYRLLREFERHTGLPVLLNTSLNVNAEPIVDNADDALQFLMTSEVDFLVLGEFIVTRRSHWQERVLTMFVELPEGIRIAYSAAGGWSIYHGDRHDRQRALSPLAAGLLSSPRRHAVITARGEMDIGPAETENLREELWKLWRWRLVRLRPSPPSEFATE